MGLANLRAKSSSTLSAENTFCDAIMVHGHASLITSGTWSGTLTMQASIDDGATWIDVPSGAFTSNVDRRFHEPAIGVLYRIGFKTGGYTSGDAVVTIYQ
jgi:hypothetical protein